ncbi:AraC family transcriptional regulator [Gluconacetobacter tumulisoli]|uniref:AraC family transcriptional regulator n=1 Tax=Gluconacetobacter tumulisoli TaxID=1286189 RepID=A0A7W4PML1_9PROT|nr:AraC family transcriptional regulator [Gluconacetobacter tumulisoli]MBB2203108.1 AraC family transcriptional regulator [Gluconacetobacter tumulisoli]
MHEPLTVLRDTIARHCRDASARTAIPGLVFYRADAPTTPVDCVYEPRFCMIVQGSKQVMLCDRIFDYDASNYLIATVDLPVTGQVVKATPEQPYLSLCLSIDPAQIASLLLDMHAARTDHGQLCCMCLGVSPLTPQILDPAARLVGLLDTPQDIPVLAPMIVRELLYRLLHGEQGNVLRQIASAESNLSQINSAISWIRRHFAEQFDIATVARIAGMSPSSFHRHFRAATMMSPLQYRTRLRLQEARKRLMTEGADAAEVGFAVGYDSPSQFSREYRRMFGKPPVRDVNEIRVQPAADVRMMAESL